MTRTTKGELEQLVRVISTRLGRPEYQWDRVGDKNVCRVGALTLDYSYGQPRLNEMLNSGGGVREVGPRLPSGQMETQLRAILYGIDLAEASIGGYGSLPRWDKAPDHNHEHYSSVCGNDCPNLIHERTDQAANYPATAPR